MLETLGLESERRKLAAIEDAEQPASSGCKAMQCHWPSCLTILENMWFIQTIYEQAWRQTMKRVLIFGFLLLTVNLSAAEPQARNLFLLTLDGLRWQEVFRGIDESLAANPKYNNRIEDIKQRYWTDNKLDRAAALMPFLHRTVFTSGTVVGNRDKNSCARVTNSWYFSYPGYNEILTGLVDETIDSNKRIPNTNETFLEKLNQSEAYKDKVAAFASWDVFPYILNVERSGIPLNAFPKSRPPENEFERFLERLEGDIPSPWEHVRLDAFTHHYALSYIRNHSPRIVYIAYGEADDFAHDGRYEEYLLAANRTDRFIEELWEFIQHHADYKDQTVLFITSDHGRGEVPEESWQHHASKRAVLRNEEFASKYKDGIVGSESVWMAAIGPGIPAQGLVATGDQCLTSNRIAATLLELLGEDYRLFNPNMGEPMQQFTTRVE